MKRHQLAHRRKTAGYSQEQLAEQLGVERSTVARWEAGDTEPQPWVRPKLATALGVTIEVLDELLAVSPAPSPDGRLAYVLAQPSRVDGAAIGQLAEQVRHLGIAYETKPSASLLAEAGQCHASIALLLSQASSDRLRRELQAIAAASAILLSQLVWDASQRRDSVATLAYCTEAMRLAQEQGDAITAANAQLRMSYVSLYGLGAERQPRAGLAAAEAAARTSTGASHALTGLALLHVAEALAMLGEYRRCERALSQAESQLAATGHDDAGAEFFAPTQLGRLAGSCYLFLGHPERTQPILEDTAGALHARKKTRSLVLGNLALAYLRQRQLDAATATLHDAIDLLEQTRGGGGLTVAFAAGRELYPWRHEGAVQDVNDRLLALMART